MKKTIKILVSCILCVSLVLGLCISAFAANDNDVKHYSLYTCLGDSIPGIFRDEGYITHGFKEIEGTYPNIIHKTCCDAMNTYAYAGFTTNQLCYMLDKDYVFPADTLWAEPELCNEDTLRGMRDDIIKSVKNSDLITINIGSNDVFTVPLFAALSGDYSSVGLTNEEFEAGMNTGSPDPAGLALFVTYFLEKLSTRYSEVYNNMEKIITDIQSMNSKDADIVIVGMYNPFDSMNLSQDIKIAVGDIGYGIVCTVNAMYRELACKYDCIYVNDVGTETAYTNSGLALTDETTFALVPDYIHPTAAGHQYLAKQILAALPSRPIYKITLEGISEAEKVFLDGKEYPVNVNNGVVTVNADSTEYKTAAVYDKCGQQHLWTLTFENGAYTAKALCAVTSPCEYSKTTAKSMLQTTASTAGTLLKKLLK